MKKVKVIAILSIFCMLLGLCGGVVNAETGMIIEGGYVTDPGQTSDNPTGYICWVSPYHWAASKTFSTSNGKPAYCVQPGKDMTTDQAYNVYRGDDAATYYTDPYYSDSNTLTAAQWRKIGLYAWYGWLYPGHEAGKWYQITQNAIWRIAEPGGTYGFCSWAAASAASWSSQPPIIPSQYASETAELEQLVTNHDRMPNISLPSEMIIGTTYSVTDTNGVLSACDITGTTNCTATKSGNTLNITPTDVGTISVSFKKGDLSAQGHALFTLPGKQNLIERNTMPGKASSVSGQAVGGKITVVKQDAETGATAQGDGTLAGAVYGVYNGSGTLVSRLTMGSDRSAQTDYLAPGTYVVREITPSTGYNLSNTNYSTTISTANLNPTVTVDENVIKGSIEIKKRLQETDYDPEINLEGAQFKVTLISSGATYYTSTSGSNGVCRIDNLPYGRYKVEESTVPASGLKIDDFTVFVSANGAVYSYTKVDVSKKMEVELTKVLRDDAIGRTDAKVSGACFTMYLDAACTVPYKDKNGRTVVIGPTNDAGYAKSQKMRTGTYYLKETTFPEGINPDEPIPGEGITYREKVYVASYDNRTQTTENITVNLGNIINFPYRGSVEIKKRLQETDYDPEINLEGAQFKITLISTGVTYYTNVSGTDGVCRADDLLYGRYKIEESTVPPSALKIPDFNVFIQANEVYYFTKVDVSKKMKVELTKVLYDKTIGRTDAKVSGAYFTMYLDEACTVPYIDKNGNPVIIGPTDENGYAVSRYMRTGTYYLKETTFPEGINGDETIPGETITYRQKVYTASYDNRLQTVEHITVNIGNIVNFPYRGRVQVIKYESNPDSTVKSKAEGAVLRLTLDSNPATYYDATIDEYGYAEFIYDEFNHEPYSPYTLPYGHYTITEIAPPTNTELAHTYYYIQSERVFVDRHEDDEYRIETDDTLEAYLKIVKKDKVSNRVVALKGATFKIWYCGDEIQGKEPGWVEQYDAAKVETISEYTTNQHGYLYTPQTLEAGRYVLYEVQAPQGYYLQDNLRVPENEADLGNAAVSGQEVIIDKLMSGLRDTEITPEHKLEPGDVYVEVELKDNPLTVDLYIHKVGEKIDGSTSRTERYQINDNEDFEEELYTPTYKEVGLQGVGYNIYAVNDTCTPDGILRYTQGQLVAHIETDENGDAVARKLYPGEYKIEEVLTPIGYLKDTDIPNVILENEDQYVETATKNKELSDIRQKIKLTIEKAFADVRFSNNRNLGKKAIFGIYAKEAIYSYNGRLVIPANGLMDLVTITDNGVVENNVELPAGKYYVKELYASYPYAISEDIVEYELEYTGDTTQANVVVPPVEPFMNEYDSASFALLKISTSESANLIIDGTKTKAEDLDQKILDVINELTLMTEADARAYARANIKVLAGATYGVYVDEACTKPLYIDPDGDGVFEPAVYVTDEDGMITAKEVPFGKYYVKEMEAPEGYDISDQVVEIVLNNTVQDTLVYRILTDDSVLGEFITKTDIFTGDVVPDCVFEIRDAEDNVIVHSITDEEGNAFIPLDIFEDGETYYYVEIAAPDIYDINTEPHEFVAEFDEDGNWVTEKMFVENIRKTREVIVRKLDAETAEPLEGCVFTIALIDEETGEIKVNPQTKEEIYLVENATTNEDGEYVIEDAPMGTYRFIEIKAPEGYELDEDLTGYEFTIDNDSPDTIIFEVTNTGDIPVVAIVCTALVCIAGIAFVALRRKTAK